MVVEKEGFGAVKSNNICYCLVIIVKKNIVYIACSTRGMFTEIFLK